MSEVRYGASCPNCGQMSGMCICGQEPKKETREELLKELEKHLSAARSVARKLHAADKAEEPTLLYCPGCGRVHNNEGTGKHPCCNPKCKGDWGTNCYHYHHPSFAGGDDG